MKKIIFGILSLLLITPVFAEDFSFTPLNSFVSFESLNSNSNITYSFFAPFYHWYGNNNFLRYSNFIVPYYFDSFYGLHEITSFYNSQSNQSGSVFDTSISGAFTISGSIISGYHIGGSNNNGGSYNSLFAFGGSDNILDNKFFVYFQGVNSSVVSSSGNLVLPFSDYSNNYILWNQNPGFVRVLYDSDSNWFDNSEVPLLSSISNPISIQIFPKDSNYIYTNKGRFYINGVLPDKIISSLGDGFSLINKFNSSDTFYLDDIKFYSVFPYFTDFYSSSSNVRILSGGLYKQGLYIFKVNSFSRNSDFQEIGVLKLCDSTLCSGLNSVEDLLSSMVFSNYLCDFSSSFDFDNCLVVGGGILLNVLNTTGYNVPLNLNYNGFVSDLFYTSLSSLTPDSNSLSISINNSPYSLVTHRKNIEGSSSYRNIFSSNSYNISYTGGYSISNPPDIFAISNLYIPDIPVDPNAPLTTGKVVDILDTLCKSSLIKPAFCNGVDQVSTGVDGFWDLDGSGKLIYTLINTDPNNMGWGDITPNGSGGFNIICSDQDGFGCPLLENAGSSGYLDYGSGFILGTDYYETFFQKTGRFFTCPYGYIVLDTNSFLKVLNKFNNISEAIGFDFMLPINCSIAAFTQGKNYKFLNDVDLGLNPLMGQIQGPDDPRVYLYRFFDFLMSIALLFFLLKLYHLIF